eukprot:8160776-Lingulodinium_polyedra.AAC.1
MLDALLRRIWDTNCAAVAANSSCRRTSGWSSDSACPAAGSKSQAKPALDRHGKDCNKPAVCRRGSKKSALAAC